MSNLWTKCNVNFCQFQFQFHKYPLIIFSYDLSVISDLVVDNQQNQKERYLKDIRERVDHMSAIHQVVQERLVEKLAKERAEDLKPMPKNREETGDLLDEELRDAEPEIMRTLGK